MNLSQLQTACLLHRNIALTVNYPLKKVTATEKCLKLAESHLSVASSHYDFHVCLLSVRASFTNEK